MIVRELIKACEKASKQDEITLKQSSFQHNFPYLKDDKEQNISKTAPTQRVRTKFKSANKEFWGFHVQPTEQRHRLTAGAPSVLEKIFATKHNTGKSLPST